MDFTTMIKAALELGVIPTLALFLVFAMHVQNRRLTNMLAQREKDNIEMLKMLIQEVADFGKTKMSRMGEKER